MLEEIMQKKNMTYYKLAKKINVSTSYMTNLKKKNIICPSFEIVCKIADALDVDVNIFRKE